MDKLYTGNSAKGTHFGAEQRRKWDVTFTVSERFGL